MTSTNYSTLGASTALQYVDSLLLNPNKEKFASLLSNDNFEAVLDRKGSQRFFKTKEEYVTYMNTVFFNTVKEIEIISLSTIASQDRPSVSVASDQKQTIEGKVEKGRVIDDQSFIIDFTQSPPKISAIKHYYRPQDLPSDVEKKVADLSIRDKLDQASSSTKS